MRATNPRRDAAFAAFLAVVLSAGVLGVLLLNTAMQQQALAVARSHTRLAALSDELQTLKARLDWTSDPAALAARARRLQLRPVKRVDYVRVNARTPAAGRARGG